jgi:hypothetical protein
MNEDTLFEMADRAWEQFEFNGRGVKVTFDNYDAVRTAFMEGYLQAVREYVE